MSDLNIIADPNIPFVEAVFGRFGNLYLKPGRQWKRSDVAGRDLVLVRSVTPVNEELLEGSGVRMVATATSGTDHIDKGFLADAGIHFADAAGSNAIAVAEYVLSCLCLNAQRLQRPLTELSLGIVGCGHVGSALAARAEALQISCFRNDPPLAQIEPHLAPHCLAETLAADVVSLHVPLIDGGEYPTRGLIDAAALRQISDHAALINAARGGVVDEAALRQSLGQSPGRVAMLDCWEGEPAINPETLAATMVSTPHIAGYSADGRVRGTAMLYAAVRDFFGFTSQWPEENLASVYPTPAPLSIDADDDDAALRQLILDCYDVRVDSQKLVAVGRASPSGLATGFDELRRNYPARRELASRSVYRARLSASVQASATALGLRLID